MAGKLPNDADKGRCSRCALSYFGAPARRTKDYPNGNCCWQYGDYCQRVAWNCKAPSRGWNWWEIRKEVLEDIEMLRVKDSLPKKTEAKNDN